MVSLTWSYCFQRHFQCRVAYLFICLLATFFYLSVWWVYDKLTNYYLIIISTFNAFSIRVVQDCYDSYLANNPESTQSHHPVSGLDTFSLNSWQQWIHEVSHTNLACNAHHAEQTHTSAKLFPLSICCLPILKASAISIKKCVLWMHVSEIQRLLDQTRSVLTEVKRNPTGQLEHWVGLPEPYFYKFVQWNLGIRDTQGTVKHCPEFWGGLISQVYCYILIMPRNWSDCP